MMKHLCCEAQGQMSQAREGSTVEIFWVAASGRLYDLTNSWKKFWSGQHRWWRGRLRALPSGEGLRQSANCFSTRDAALKGPLLHGDVGSGISHPFAKGAKGWGTPAAKLAERFSPGIQLRASA